MNSKLEKLSLVVFNLILSIGCFWQIFNVCDLYFKYPTNIFIETNFDAFVKQLPAITFCGETEQFYVNWNSTQVFESRYANFTKDMFTQIIIYGVGYETSLLDKFLATAVETLSWNRYCVTVNSDASDPTHFDNIATVRFGLDRFGKWSKWWVFLHSPNDIVFSSEWSTMLIRKNTYNLLTWDLRSYRLMESPYRTNCKNYWKIKNRTYLSRRDCIRQCKIRVSQLHCEAVIERIDVRRDEPTVRFAKNDSCLAKINFTHTCGQECPHPDCALDFYKPILLHSSPREGSTLVNFNIQNDPETIYKHEPKIELIEMICYLASTISMWFGLSFYSVRYLFFLCRNRLIKQEHNCESSKPIKTLANLKDIPKGKLSKPSKW